jgi:hypothetical protein
MCRLGEELRNLGNENQDDDGEVENDVEEDADESETTTADNIHQKESNEPRSANIISLTKKTPSTEARLSAGLKASRDGREKTVPSASSRLMKTAFKSTLQSNEKKRSMQTRDSSSTQPHESKRQRVVQVTSGGRGKGGFVTSHSDRTHSVETPHLNPQQILEAQAHQSGFNSVEEMMAAYFQKNMFAMMQSMSQSGGFGMPFQGYPQGPQMTQPYPFSTRGRGRGRSPRGTYR